MSKNLETYSLISDMRDDLMRCYREVAPNCMSQSGAWRRTVKHPAKRFYIGGKWAASKIGDYLRGKPESILKMKRNRRRMYFALLEVVKELMEMPEHKNKCLKAICDIAVKRPAPEFFLDPDYMKLVFIRVKYKRFDDNGCLLNEYKYDYGDRYKGKYSRV